MKKMLIALMFLAPVAAQADEDIHSLKAIAKGTTDYLQSVNTIEGMTAAVIHSVNVDTLAVFALMMKIRDGAVRREIEEGRHDPVWGNHIRRQRQREADALYERNPLTRPLLRLACLLGIHKNRV